MWFLLISALLIGAGGNVYVGTSAHSPRADCPEYCGSNPLGTVRVEKDKGRLRMYCSHMSSIPNFEDGYGSNDCGLLFKVK